MRGLHPSRRASGRRILAAGSVVAIVTSVNACGVTSRLKTEPVVLAALNRCLVKQGIAHPEDIPGPSQDERPLPILIGIRGARVPVGVTRGQFQAAMKKCGAGFVRVAPSAVTDRALQQRVRLAAACLARNGFTLPAPNFPGPGPVLDTSGVDTTSSRWLATVKGCLDTKQQLTQGALEKCMGARALEGSAKTNPAFEQSYLGLHRCLRKASA